MIDNSNDKPKKCNSCDFETSEVRAYPFFAPTNRNTVTHKWLCGLCASTLAGVAYEYPEQYPNASVLSAISFVGNTILAKLEH